MTRVVLHGLAASALALGLGLGLPLPAAPAPATSAPGAAAAESPTPVSIVVERREIAVNVGDQFELPSTITNDSAEPAAGLIAHLDVLGTDPKRYVDPEDWCTERTVFLDPLAPGESVRHSWPMHAVDIGPLLVWVTVTRAEGEAVAVSQPARLAVGEHIDVNAEGVLPLVVGVPALLFGSAAALSWRRRRLSAR